MKQRESMNGPGVASRAVVALLVAVVALQSSTARAIFGIEPHYRHGAVYARALVLTEGGKPIYVNYDESGREVGEIGAATGELADNIVMSGAEFRGYIELLTQFQADHANDIAKDSFVVTSEGYASANYLTVDDELVVKPTLLPGTRSVLLRHKDQRFVPEQVVLLELPVNLVDVPSGLENAKSVLLESDGTLHQTSEHNIGFKVGFFGDDPSQATRRGYGDKIHGPVAGVPIEVGVFIGGRTSTNDEGKFSTFYFVPPCPGFTFDYTTPIWAELRYQNFNPQGAEVISYYLQRPDYTFCNGLGAFPPSYSLSGLMAQVAVIGILATQARVNITADFPVDVMMLMGGVGITNSTPVTQRIGGPLPEVTLGDPTGYTVEKEEQPPGPFLRQTFNFDGDVDANGDDIHDLAVRGSFVTLDEGTETEREIFVRDDEAGELQAIYLSSDDTRDPNSDDEAVNQPHFTRALDFDPYTKSLGLLKSLSFADVEDTDIYVFRRSTGKLVMERQGLPPSEVGNLASSTIHEADRRLVYRLLIRGPKDFQSLTGRRHQDFSEWQSSARMSEELYARQADHLRAGEQVQVVVINRPTGYIGSTVTELQSANQGNPGDISVRIDDILMGPPNLKISARRRYEITHGATADGVPVEYVVGFEGAGLTTDREVEIRTEWFAADGSALPEDLGKFGYTGRLARVDSPGSLGSVTSLLADFSIKPGSQVHVVQLGANNDASRALLTQHFYVHVSGQPKDRTPAPSFAVSGAAGAGALQYRPDRYVPVIVQRFDEVATIEQDKVFRQELRNDPNPPPTPPDPPPPIYHEAYRPEFQFSVFDLKVDELTRVKTREDGSEEQLQILEEDAPTIASSDDLVSVLFSLIDSQFERLTPLDGEQVLVLSLGETEHQVKLEPAQQLVKFENLEALALLDPLDLLAIRLYTNSDPSNILWQYAFYLNIAFVDRSGEVVRREAGVSYPKPFIKLGAGSELDDLDTSHFSLVDPVKNTVQVTVNGRVFCDVADLIEDDAANITDVVATVSRLGREEGFEEVTVSVSNAGDDTLQDMQPLLEEDGIDRIEDEKHPFEGTFTANLQIDVVPGRNVVWFEAVNALGTTGTAALAFDSPHGSPPGTVTNVQVPSNDAQDRGVFKPIWVRIVNDDVDESNYMDEDVTVFGKTWKLTQHEDEEFYADRPFIQVTDPLQVTLDPEKSGNVLNALVVAQPSTAEFTEPSTSNLIQESLGFSDTRLRTITAVGPDTYSVLPTYAAGTTVRLTYVSPLIFEGWTIKEAKVTTYDGSVFLSLFRSWDDDAPRSKVEKKSVIDLDGRPAAEVVLTFTEDAHESRRKRVEIELADPEDEENTLKVRAFFDVVPLKTVVVAVDGFAHRTAVDTISVGGSNFARIFGNGVGADNKALSALPTITWANWPGVFSGGPPREHGWLGNSFFPRETATGVLRYPIFSSGKESKLNLSGAAVHVDVQQQAGVALGGIQNLRIPIRIPLLGNTIDWYPTPHGYSMDERSLVGAGSLYGIIADALGKTPAEPLRAESVRVFYDRSAPNVDMSSSFFGALTTRGHDKDAAASIDDSISPFRFGTGILSSLRWTFNKDLDVMSIYLPGPDNIGHGLGLADINGEPLGVPASQQYADVVNPLPVMAQHAKGPTDSALGRVLRRIESSGYSNAVMFAVTADHGQHAFRREEDFIFLTEEAGILAEAPAGEGGMDMEFYDSENMDDAKIVYSPDGGLGQYYIIGTDGTWQKSPTEANVRKLASLLYREGKGHKGFTSQQIYCDFAPRKVGESCTELEKNLFGFWNRVPREGWGGDPGEDWPETDGMFGEHPAIFVKTDFQSDYQWVKSVDATTPYAVTLSTIEDFLNTTGFHDDWPDFVARMDEMNHKHDAGSRSGDIVVVVDGRAGYLTVNNTHEEFPGWHGGPTIAESEVPLIFGMPGRDFVDAGGTPVFHPPGLDDGYQKGLNDEKVLSTRPGAGQGSLRNWQLAYFLKHIIKEFRCTEPTVCD